MKKIYKYEVWYDHAVKKTFLIMRLVLVISLVCFMQSFALNSYTQNSKISLSVKQMKLEDILMQIESETKYRFAYNKTDIDVDQVYTINIQEAEIKDVLNRLFAENKIRYSVIDRQVILSKPEGAFEISQQSLKVSGKVTDTSDMPVPGVSIVVKGTSLGVITDANGGYSLSNVPANATLVFSFVGMKTQEIMVAGQSNINVIMEEETIGIEEVVAIGYGTVKKKDLTGAVAQVSPIAYKAQPVQGIAEMLRGNAPGVVVKTNGDGSVKIRIRGSNSLNGNNDPLYIVDGVPMGSYSPNDVESIEILKDASATAVVLITT